MATNWPTSRDTFTNPSSSSTLDSPSHAAQHANINDAVEAMQLYAGLVLVKTQTITGTPGSVTVTDAFSSTFENYRIVVQLTASASSTLEFTLVGTGASGYYASMSTRSFGGSAANTDVNNGAYWPILSMATAYNNHASIDVYSPNIAANKSYFASGSGGSVRAIAGGGNTSAFARTGFALAPSTGTFTAGTIRVYGYNNG